MELRSAIVFFWMARSEWRRYSFRARWVRRFRFSFVVLDRRIGKGWRVCSFSFVIRVVYCVSRGWA